MYKGADTMIFLKIPYQTRLGKDYSQMGGGWKVDNLGIAMVWISTHHQSISLITKLEQNFLVEAA